MRGVGGGGPSLSTPLVVPARGVNTSNTVVVSPASEMAVAPLARTRWRRLLLVQGAVVPTCRRPSPEYRNAATLLQIAQSVRIHIPQVMMSGRTNARGGVRKEENHKGRSTQSSGACECHVAYADVRHRASLFFCSCSTVLLIPHASKTIASSVARVWPPCDALACCAASSLPWPG